MRSQVGGKTILLAGVALATVWSAPAFAQTAPAEEQAHAVGDIVVTAQRREQSINEVGMGIQAFGAEALDNLQVTDVKDLTIVAPSFTVTQGYHGVPIYTLRGIGFNTINLSSTSTVGSYVDEVAYAYPFMLSGPIFDIGRVEVLKGPQGTLYGRNTTAGLVSFVTNAPSHEFEATGTIEVGNYETVNFETAVSGPLGDRARVRFALRKEYSGEGWQEDMSSGDTQGKVDRLGARFRLDWEPTDNLSFNLSLSGWTNDSDTITGQAIGYTPATDPGIPGRFAAFNAPGLVNYVATNRPTHGKDASWAPRNVRNRVVGTIPGLDGDLKENSSFFGAALRTTLDFNEDVRLVSLTSYNYLDRNALSDWSGAPYEIMIQRLDGEAKSFSQELRLEGQTERLTWLIGAYYADDKLIDNNITNLNDNANVTMIRYQGNLLLGTPFNSLGYTSDDMLGAFRGYRDLGRINADTKSIFAHGEWKLSDRLNLTTGVRWTNDRQTYVGCSADNNGSMLPNVNVVNRALIYNLFGGVFAPTIGLNECNTYNPALERFAEGRHEIDEENVGWRLGLDWKASDDVLIYGSISEGYKAGNTPINAANVSTQNEPALQEKLLAYELGTKAGLADNRIQLNVAAFYYDYTDKQISVYFADPIYTALRRLQNVPESKAYGIDAEVTWRVTDAFTLNMAATKLTTEVINYHGTNANGQPQIYDGIPFPNSPEWQASVTASYDAPISERLGLQATLNYRWQSDTASDLSEGPLFEVDAFGTLNGSVGLYDLDGRWKLNLWGRNLTDEYYWTSVSSNANLAVRFAGKPRTFGLNLSYAY
ncbi:TonB-dependent receptor [uncultured Brevundimonas sp.]|uniref:TonB-dependent receptor n=1 Tax=uncultured Brevundimonas sp. TaxID=213418 RepID=UPI002616A418|nr:TonB-dependent receptor [uncultured Brevundimonas sp.]